MRDLREIMGELVASGLSTEQHLLVLELTAAVAAQSAPTTDDPEARKRRLGAERQARYAAAKRQKTSETDAQRQHASASEPRQKASESVRNDADPHARVRDNLPRLVISGNLTTPDSASAPDFNSDLDWPETDRPGRAYLDKLQAALTEAGSPALASLAVAPKLADLSFVLRLGREGKGPRCELQADVLPVIRARSAKAPPGSVKSWDFFRDAILEARDRRLSGAPAVADVVPLRATGPPRSSWDRAEDMRREGARRLLDKLAAEE